jgi:FlaA1/EpsC-like NDP-sugar epimerase
MFLTNPSLVAQIGTRLVSMKRNNKVALMLAVDAISLPLCFLVAMLLRVGDVHVTMRYGVGPYILVGLITIPVFTITGLYGAVIRFIDMCLLTVTGIGLALVVVITYFLLSMIDYNGVPRTALMIYWFIAFSYVVTSRLVARALVRNGSPRSPAEIQETVAIYGAGEAGAKLVHAMRLGTKYRPVCFFDDKRALENCNVAGLKVINSERMAISVSQRNISLMVIAIPSATPEQRRAILVRAHQAGVTVKTLCSLLELADDKISTRSIRDIKIDDLLGREPIRPQHDLFARCVQEQNILVTGAGGSIGSELCRQITTLAPCQLHLLDHCEYALYNTEQELRARFPKMEIHAHLGSVCDARLVERIMDDGKINTVYHAAAYKHVPMVEENMAEGVRNNVLGAEVVANAAGKYGVRTCVLISTDKAVRPTSVMGASKRIAELIFQAAAIRTSATKFCIVRFGNVLGSSGSVVPLFKSQIERGGPITITHPEVVRYFMSVSEAAQLVMQAGAMATGGDVFVMDMGKPVKIVDLAHTMLAICGLKEKNANQDGDVEIQYVGLRPGEKLYEELFAGNDAIPSRHPRIMTTTEYVVEPDVLSKQLAYLTLACATNDKEMIKFLLHKLVRGFASKREGETPQEGLYIQDRRNPSLRHGSVQLAGKVAEKAN